MSVLSEALRYRKLGLSVIPICAGTKKPAIKRWKPYAETLPTEALIRRWFGPAGHTALAIITGSVSGDLVCRDFDTLASYQAWAEVHPEWAQRFPTVVTNRGRHVYCRADVEAVRTIAKGGGLCAVFSDGELRAGNSYVMAPPSPHPEGTPYRWQIPIDGDVPRVDLHSIGWVPCNRESRANGEDREDGENRENRGELKTLVGRGLVDSRSLSPPSPVPNSGLPCSLDSLPSLLQEKIRQAIERTVPKVPGKRHKQLFELARELKSIPELADQPAKALKPILRQWHKQAKAVSQTAFDESWFDFSEAWGKVKFPKGQEPIALALQKARETEPPAIATQYEEPQIRLLVGWCRELQRLHGAEPFYLACRIAGKYLGVDHATVSRWLRGLCHDEVLAEVSKGSQKEHQASRYQYLGDVFDDVW